MWSTGSTNRYTATPSTINIINKIRATHVGSIEVTINAYIFDFDVASHEKQLKYYCNESLYGIFEYRLQAPHEVLFATPVFDYCGFNCNIIAGLTAIAVTVATRNENENSGALIAPNDTNIERQESVVEYYGSVCFVLFVKCCMIIHMYKW